MTRKMCLLDVLIEIVREIIRTAVGSTRGSRHDQVQLQLINSK